jgi:competence protein ComEC
MQRRKATYIFLSALFILVLILAGIIFHSQSRDLKVIFLDVGQGDAILIERGSQQILIDGGPSGQVLLDKLGKYIPFWDRNIELVMESHPDADHITGLVDVLKNYSVGAVMQTSATSDSQVYRKLQELIQTKNINIVTGERGEKINLGAETQLEVLGPSPETPTNAQDTNAASIVTKLSFGDNSFLFTGDLPSEQEAALISAGLNLNSRVLKVGHHGSKYSSSPAFLGAVHPTDAVISVGKNNRYGHPAPEIMDRLKSNNINIFRTDELGDIAYECADVEKRCAMVAN